MESAIQDVATSYDNIAKINDGDLSSGKTPFRAFNNYVKRALIQVALDVLHHENSGLHHAAVLDLASGRGGDIGKWIYAKSSGMPRLQISHYHCFDISSESIKEAEKRFLSYTDTNVTATFEVADCFSDAFLNERLPSLSLYHHYNVVSIQFALHYACDTEDHIEKLMKAISEALEEGGVFIATTVDEEALSSFVREQSTSSLFSIQMIEPVEWVVPFTSKVPKLKIGSQYHFQLEGLVNSPEYVVPMMIVRKHAAIHGLVERTEDSKSFDEFLSTYATRWNNTRHLELSQEEKKLVHLYRTVCFEKKRSKPLPSGGAHPSVNPIAPSRQTTANPPLGRREDFREKSSGDRYSGKNKKQNRKGAQDCFFNREMFGKKAGQ